MCIRDRCTIDPNTGRFTQEDPVKDGGNWYTYCGGNPITRKDETGLTIMIMGTGAEASEIYGYLRELSNNVLVLTQLKDNNGMDLSQYIVTLGHQGGSNHPVGCLLYTSRCV